MRLVLERLLRPRIEAFAPDAIVLQCGADAVEEDPMSRLALSNNAHRAVVATLLPLAPRLIVLGGGGYNPWSVARLWTGVWATLSGHPIPERLPEAAEAVLTALHWEKPPQVGRNPPAHWFTTLVDPPREGPVRPEIRARLARLEAR
jgi:acetoin utilization protein AcuC